MKIAFKCILLFLIATLAGCATKRQMTREEYLETTTRIYDKTPDEILNASEKVLRLIDGDDFSIAHTQNGLVATRNWVVYLVLAASNGSDIWVINTEPTKDGKTRVTTSISTSMGGTIAPMGGQIATAPGMSGMPAYGNASYDLFFKRLEYLLGLRAEWITCSEANNLVKTNVVWGDNSAICNSFNVKNTDPRTGEPELGVRQKEQKM